jgi:hypothetical protein
MPQMRICLGVVAIAALSGLAGCNSSEVLVAHNVALVPAAKEIPEQQLLDVAIAVFDPGVPAEGEVDKQVLEELIRAGTFVNIRRAEARYMAVELRDTLQKSKNWGRVWVTPASTSAADLNVMAAIAESDGDEFELHVTAVDATGRVWLDNKRYTMETAAGAFNRRRYPDLDPYQDVFNEIANDLANARRGLAAGEVRELREVAALRFASELSPDAFAGYVQEHRGQYELARLPANDDPMFARTESVRQREFLFLDTLNQHYTSFRDGSQDSYDGWRQYAREEAISVKELTRSARWRTGIGIATIVASIVYGSNSNNNSFSDRVIRDSLMYLGMDVLRSSSVHRQERRLHAEQLEELSTSFDDDIKPLVVNIEGTQHRLTGTAELQYEEWRQLLRQLYIEETGFVPEMDMYVEPDVFQAKTSEETPEPPTVLDGTAQTEPAAESDASASPEAETPEMTPEATAQTAAQSATPQAAPATEGKSGGT